MVNQFPVQGSIPNSSFSVRLLAGFLLGSSATIGFLAKGRHLPEAAEQRKTIAVQSYGPYKLRRTTEVDSTLDGNGMITSPPLVEAGKSENEDEQPCTSMPPPVNNLETKPIWIPNYRGSGSDLLASLVQEISGMEAGDMADPDSPCNESPVCFTHWPIDGIPGEVEPSEQKEDFSPNAVMLIRSPRNAMMFRYMEDSHHNSIPIEQSTWVAWRDDRLLSELAKWKELLAAWEDQPYEKSLTISYEALLHPAAGPQKLSLLAKELKKAGFPVAEESDLSCLWNKIVSGHKDESLGFVPTFTKYQKDYILQFLDDLRGKAEEDQQTAHLMEAYHRDLAHHIRVEE